MRPKPLLVMGIISFLVVLQASAHAQVTCQVSPSCSGVSLIGMTAETNAHAALIDGNPYSSVLCCSGFPGLMEGQSGRYGQKIVNLYASENSHVQDPSLTTYTNTVYLSIDNPTVTSFTCSYKASGCSGNDFCVLSLSSQSNAHVADCTHTYAGKICCSLSYDTAPPTISDDYAYDNVWVSGQPTINFDAQDSDSGIKEVRYCWGSACDPSTGTVLPSPYGITESGNRNDVLRYMAEDNAGNPSAVGSVTVKLDNNPPTTTCDNCPASTEVKGTAFDVRLSAADQETDVSSTEYCFYRDTQSQCTSFKAYASGSDIRIGTDCTGFGEVCTYTIRYRSTDTVGNEESIKQTSGMTIDKSSPWCEFTTKPDEYSGTRTISLAWDSDDPVTGSTLQQYQINADISTDGGNTWSSADSQTITTESQKSHTFSLGQDGYYRFSCVSTYNRPPLAVSSPSTALTTVDTLAPTVQITTEEKVRDSNFTIEWTASDDGSGLDHFSLSVDGSVVDGNLEGTQSTLDYDGTYGQGHLVEITAYDKAGNPSQTASKTITPDNQPPSCSIQSLPEYSSSNTFDLSWSSPDDDTDFYDICINSDGSACAEPYPEWGTLDYTTTQFTGGNGQKYYFSCRGTDLTGNEGEWSSTVATTIDSEPPRLKNNKPQYNTEVVVGDTYESIVINATVDDDTGISDVSIMFGDNEVLPGSTSGDVGDPQWTLTWEVPYSTYAGYSGFSLMMTDVVDNVETSVFNYSVMECLPGQSRECHPRDKINDELYSLGVCAKTASKVCGSDGTWGNCTGGTFPTSEDCNDLDDDCDGDVDEDLARKECGPANIGICRPGLRDCVNGAWSSCEGEKNPEPSDICGNGWDDNCDGSVDEGCVCEEGETQPCGESNQGICRTGSQTCSGGSWGNCLGAVLPSTETCNGMDDDCDGDVDEGCSTTNGGGGETETPEFPWWILVMIGVVILGVLAVLMLNAKKHNEELNWENLKKRYSPAYWE